MSAKGNGVEIGREGRNIRTRDSKQAFAGKLGILSLCGSPHGKTASLWMRGTSYHPSCWINLTKKL